jgi:signal peptidase I
VKRFATLTLTFVGCLLAGGCGGGTHTYKIPSSGMEPTLHCARPAPGCLAAEDDRVVVRVGGRVERGDIAVFHTPEEAALRCGEGGLFVKRVIGLPGETIHEDGHGFIDVDGKRLAEPYIRKARRLGDTTFFGRTWHVPPGDYFMLGDNRPQSCDSRVWGGVPKRNVVGPVVKIEHGS